MNFKKLFFLIAIITVASFLFFLFTRVDLVLFETVKPEIKILNIPRGLNNLPTNLDFQVKDSHSGISEIIVRLHQRNRSVQVFKEKYNGQKNLDVKLILDNSKLNFIEGKADLEIKIFDRSIWSNSFELNHTLVIDFKRPDLSVLSKEHYVYKGGASLVAYKTKDPNLGISGIRVNNQRFIGFPARSLDRTFRDDDLYLSFYVVDPQIGDNENIIAYSEDLVGNSSTEKFYNKILPRKFKDYKIKISDDYFENKIKTFVKIQKNRLKDSPAINDDLDASIFGQNLIKLKQLDRYDLVSIATKEQTAKIWEGPFLASSGVVLSGFNDTLRLIINDQEIASYKNEGFEFKTNNEQKVFALNNGVVLYSGDLGFYGNSVVLSHGLGLVTVYGFLSKINVNVGERLNLGDAVGVSGRSGLARENGYYLEFLINGVSTDPRAWWDKKWYASHIDKKILDIKKEIGLPIVKK